MNASNQTSIQVREATEADWSVLLDFNLKMALETEGRQLDAGLLESGIRAALADPQRGGYWLAQRDGRAIGSLMLTREWSDWRNGWFWWIQSVFVPAEQRRQGVFSRLYAEVIRRARQSETVAGVRLYVDRDNQGARSVYAALGMSQSHYLMYELDFVLPTDSQG